MTTQNNTLKPIHLVDRLDELYRSYDSFQCLIKASDLDGAPHAANVLYQINRQFEAFLVDFDSLLQQT
jgi:hypothetical protein